MPNRRCATRSCAHASRSRSPSFPKSWAWILRLRFGLGGGSRTLAEVGAELGLSRERIRQIEKLALERARAILARPAAQAPLRPPREESPDLGRSLAVRIGQRKARAAGKRWGGKKHGDRSTLTPETVARARALLRSGATRVGAARHLGISERSVYRAVDLVSDDCPKCRHLRRENERLIELERERANLVEQALASFRSSGSSPEFRGLLSQIEGLDRLRRLKPSRAVSRRQSKEHRAAHHG